MKRCRPQELNPSRKEIPASWIFLGLFALVVFGVGIMFLMSSFDELNSEQKTLFAVGDWMVKSAVGAILGFAGGSRLVSRNGR